MANSKTKIINGLRKLNEAVVEPDELEQSISDLVVTAKDELDIDDTEAKDFVSGIVGEGNVVEVNDEVLQNFVKQYGEKKGKQIYYATANKQNRDPENFEVEEGNKQGSGYEEYQELLNKLVNDGKGEDGQIEEGNDPDKLKRDVAIVMDKLDMSSIAPYIKKIDNPVEQAEMIGQFAEKIGVPRTKLSAVISRLRLLSKDAEHDEDVQQQHSVNPLEAKMTKGKLIETVKGDKVKKVIKTVKVKDIK